ncbi:MAG: hypothetical protein RRB24_03995 [Armatimonadota bacterium]|jgi:type II secretory pathway component PulF|nr:hypothetical protein [Armatimonadota bacterium]MDT7971969.1 hypothetical protein [Armatimonadota bacterium]
MAPPEELRRWAGALAEALEASAGQRSFVDCLAIAEQAVSDLGLAYTLRVVRNLVGQGFSPSRAMGRFPETFDGVILTIVGYGEIYGGSDRTLRRYADRPEDLCPR